VDHPYKTRKDSPPSVVTTRAKSTRFLKEPLMHTTLEYLAAIAVCALFATAYRD
jgi:hypothetical protein